MAGNVLICSQVLSVEEVIYWQTIAVICLKNVIYAIHVMWMVVVFYTNIAYRVVSTLIRLVL